VFVCLSFEDVCLYLWVFVGMFGACAGVFGLICLSVLEFSVCMCDCTFGGVSAACVFVCVLLYVVFAYV